MFVPGLPEKFLDFNVVAVGELGGIHPRFLGVVEVVPLLDGFDGLPDLKKKDFEEEALLRSAWRLLGRERGGRDSSNVRDLPGGAQRGEAPATPGSNE